MPRQIIPLTDIKIKSARPSKKNLKLFDGGGLFLLVTPSGGKLWRLKYRFEGTEQLLSLGSYPQTNLIEARQKRTQTRSLLDKGINPGTVKKAKKTIETAQSETFEVIAKEWHNKFSSTWAPSHADKIIRRLELYLFPWIGNKPIRSIATGRADHDLTPDLRGALPACQKQHYAAITDPNEVGALLRAIDDYRGSFVTLCALKLAPLFFIRPGEFRQAEWGEFDLEKAEWNIPTERLKLRVTEKARRKGEFHLVPLAIQAIAILKDLYALTGSSQYVFPSTRTTTRPMSNNTVNAALRRLGYDTKTEMTGHGFRAMARTILDEVLHIRPEIIEHQLAHAVRDPLGRAYNRTTHLPERLKMRQVWAGYLGKLKDTPTEKLSLESLS